MPWVFRFIKKFWLSDSEFVVSAPADCSEDLRGLQDILGKDIHLAEIEQWPDALSHRVGWMHQQYVKHHADLYCRGDFISFIDSDSILVRPTDFDQHLMINDKPLIWYTEYSRIYAKWGKLVSQVMGVETPYEFMRCFPLTYHKSTIAQSRDHIEAMHGMPLHDFIRTKAPVWSEFNFIGCYAWVFQKNLYEWKNTYDFPMFDKEVYRHDRVRQFHNVYDWNAGTDPYLREMYGEPIEPNCISVDDKLVPTVLFVGSPFSDSKPVVDAPRSETKESDPVQTVPPTEDNPVTIRYHGDGTAEILTHISTMNVQDLLPENIAYSAVSVTPPRKSSSYQSSIRIGLIDQSVKGWAAGANFTQMMIKCLELAVPGKSAEIVLLSRSQEGRFSTQFKSAFIGEYPTENYPKFQKWKDAIRDAGCDVVFPVRDKTVDDVVPLPFIGWVPDFQHKILPAFFEEHDVVERDQIFDSIMSNARLMLISSRSVCDDFKRFYPAYENKARIAHFPSILWSQDRKEDSEVLSRYRLPDKFALVANQFWRHKNHQILPTALGELKRDGLEVSLVLTGLPTDYRDREGKILSSFFQEIIKQNISPSVYFLGHVPYTDLVAILRAAALIIQPSFFEGWSTSIEDSKALGRPVICSDIPVHREQIPDSLGFFDPYKPKDLADKLGLHYQSLSPGPDIEREQNSFKSARQRSLDYGTRLIEIAREARDG